tara:strand:+ start:287 stop:436 length:150 start_codon:yes stop_codon:yes gene_type:complete
VVKTSPYSMVIYATNAVYGPHNIVPKSVYMNTENSEEDIKYVLTPNAIR